MVRHMLYAATHSKVSKHVPACQPKNLIHLGQVVGSFSEVCTLAPDTLQLVLTVRFDHARLTFRARLGACRLGQQSSDRLFSCGNPTMKVLVLFDELCDRRLPADPGCMATAGDLTFDNCRPEDQVLRTL
jgi:hypothetical protein